MSSFCGDSWTACWDHYCSIMSWPASIAELPAWKIVTILIPPTLALVYALTIALFLPFFRECPWSTHLSSLVPRISVLAAFVATTAALKPDQTGFYAVLFLLSVAMSVFLVVYTRLYVVEGGRAPPLVDMKGQVVLITGANTGIGKETTSQLVERGARVIMACRSADKALAAKKDIVNTHTNATIDVLTMDLSSLESIKNAVNEWTQNNKMKIDVLILNAGVMMAEQVVTKDGYELVMQANHLGHFLLTKLLIDKKALNTESGRVLTVTSSTYSFVDSIDLNDLFCTKGRKFTLFGQYEMSKLANILFSNELDRRYPNLFTASIHPGLVRTDVVRNMPWYLAYPNIIFAWAMWTLQKTPGQGAWCTTYLAATSLSDLTSGCYWVNRKVQEMWPCAKDTAGAALLWRDSAKYVGVEP